MSWVLTLIGHVWEDFIIKGNVTKDITAKKKKEKKTERNIDILKNVSGYVCNHGSPSGERDTASPRGRYGERLQRDSCLKIHM